MSKRHSRRKKSKSLVDELFEFIVGGIALLLLWGGFEIYGLYRQGSPNYVHLNFGLFGDLSGYIVGAFAVAIVLAILAWRRLGNRSRWAQKVLGIRTINDIYALTPGQFEEFVAFLFEHQGYHVKVVGQTGDEGIDIELRRRGEAQPPRVVAQCKRYRGSVGQPIVREFFGSFANEAVEGYLVTTGTFTEPAREWATSRPLRLIDGAELLRWTEQVARHLPGPTAPVPTYS